MLRTRGDILDLRHKLRCMCTFYFCKMEPHRAEVEWLMLVTAYFQAQSHLVLSLASADSIF
jgi:hypothetical protein